MSESTSSPTPPSKDEYAKARAHLVNVYNVSSSQSSCLSILHHEVKDVRDLRGHFFRCLGFKKGAEVLNKKDHPLWNQAEKLDIEDTEFNTRVLSLEGQDLNQGKGVDERFDIRYITALTLQAELKRIEIIRKRSQPSEVWY